MTNLQLLIIALLCCMTLFEPEIRRFSPHETKKLLKENAVYSDFVDDVKEQDEANQKIFGITCLEMDDSMTSITANAYDIFKPSKDFKKEIYTKFLSLCRVPDTYINLLWSQGVAFIPIFYRHGLDEDFLEQMDYIDGMVLIGGTVYNRFPTNYAKDKGELTK